MRMSGEVSGSLCRSAVFSNETLSMEVTEVPAVSRLRRLRGAPSSCVLGAVSLGARAPLPWRVVRDACVGWPRAFPDLFAESDGTATDANVAEALRAEKETFQLREVVVSSTGFEAQASVVRNRGERTSAHGVSRFALDKGNVLHVRTQPLRPQASALVFQCADLDVAAANLHDRGLVFQRVGRSAGLAGKGQLLLEAPWVSGLELRLCDLALQHRPMKPFYEAHVHQGLIPELQNTDDGKDHDDVSSSSTRKKKPIKGDCWMEARAILRRPAKFYHNMHL